MKKYLLIIITLALTWVVIPANAQDTLTVMQYNLLYYGNHQSGFADCFETTTRNARTNASALS